MKKNLYSVFGVLVLSFLVISCGKDKPVTMKIVDYRFVGSVNAGTVYVFDYFDADSLLQSIKFTPVISYPQAIRTMHAETNNPQNRVILSDTNELLDYHFKDRLRLDDVNKKEKTKTRGNKHEQTCCNLFFSVLFCWILPRNVLRKTR